MDPKACLELATDQLSQGELIDSRNTLRQYAYWRTRGGFEPIVNGMKGDVMAHRMASRIRRYVLAA